MTETKTPYTVDVSIDTMRLDLLAGDYIIGHAMHDARRLEAGETVTYAPGKTTRLMTQEEQAQHEATEQFYTDVRAIVDQDAPLVWLAFAGQSDYGELVLDGRFTLEQLKVLVAAWEKLSESTKPIDTTANRP